MQSSCPGLNKRTSVVLSKSNYPYVTQSSDLIHHDHLFTKVKFPDVDPSLLNDIEFNEDSFESYCFNCNKEFDVVATLYFIDTAYNIVDYIKGIKKVLKEGGLWINLGPLHWVHDKYDSFHFSLNETSDLINSNELFVSHKFPNVDPSLLNTIDFSESPFEEYCNECVIQFDCVCTLYFIDTAYNIVDYIKGIKKVLKEGGLWINLGPLHWVHDKYDSFHFSLNEIFDICEEVGFTIEHKEFINDTLYIPTSNSTCPLTYKNMFFVLRNGKK